MRGYSLGKRVYDLRDRIGSLQSGISSRDSEIDRLHDEMKAAKGNDRRNIRDRIDDMERERRRMRREADDLGYELTNAERDLDFFRHDPMARLSPPGY